MNNPPKVRKRRFNYFIPIAILGGIGVVIYTARPTWRVYFMERDKANQMRKELAGYHSSQLKQKENDQMLNPVQKEEEARRMGFAKPNEAPLK